MEKKLYTLNTLLAVLVTVALAAARVVATFWPRMILPQLDGGSIVALSLAALVLDAYVAPGAKRCWICIPVFAALTFGLLPFAACFVGALEALKLAVLGAVLFTAVTWTFGSMVDRISTGPAAKAAPLVSAICLYLAAQCLMGII